MEADASLLEAAADRVGRVPSVVVRDLARDVVCDVRLGDAVRRPRAEPAPEAARAAEQIAVDGREGAAGEGEGAGAVVGEERVSVLEEGDEDEPVVDPVIWQLACDR